MESNKPYSAVDDCVQDDPTISFNVELLDGCSISSCFITDCVYVSVSKSAAVWSTHCLLQTRQRFLIHRWDFKVFTLFEILSFERAADDVHKVFKLSYSEVDSIVHHFSQCLESSGRNIEQQDLRTWYISTPIELVSLVSTNDENIAFVDYYYFAFADFLIVNFETRPF